MNEEKLIAVLAEKEALVRALVGLSQKQNSALREKALSRAAEIDIEKSECSAKIEALDRELRVFGAPGKEHSKTPLNTVKNINSAFEELINLEKQNEALVSSMAEHLANARTESYRKLAGL
ncbi:MAG TPA: hypothetical protein ENN43_00435 [bacterium]|nr:hypothetical protein [bacterium]